MKPRPRAISPSTSHEELFAQRYRWLKGWAMRLTNNDREQAEDLVHDTFVQYMISQPDLDAIQENVEGYFYGMLRNMHVSQVRRALRIRETAFPIADILSISETASVQTELRLAGQRLQVQDELCRICQYASIRKNSSKVGSVVILRFFHGYYPNEIAAVTGSSRSAVDNMLQRARAEARLYLKDPESLSFLNGEQAPELQTRFGQEPQDFLRELRDALYRSRPAECLSSAQLREAYQTKQTDRLSPQVLAHVVCCAVCLDEVNRLLGLPLLAEREPEEMTGRDKSDRDKGNGGSGDGSGATGDFMDKPRRRLKQVLEHRPKELRVSVNGFILGSHTINSDLNKLSISAKGEEKVGFVEVFSEEEVRLLFCVVDAPPDGPVERKVTADLSDDRTLELFLDFSDSWPGLNVTYHDPTFAAAASEVLNPQSQIQAESELISEKSDNSHLASPNAELLKRCSEWFSSRLSRLNWRLFLRPGTVTAVFALLLIAVLIFVQLHQAPSPTASAAELLQRSIAAEDAVAARTDQVLHRTVNFEEKKLTGEVIARRKLEVWQGGERGITARRLYDERGALLAGDWRRADGVQTLYAHGQKPQLQLTPEKRGGIGAVDFDTAWQLSPSAKEFRAMVPRVDGLRLEERAGTYVISYAREYAGEASNAPGLVSTTLLLSRSDLHPTEQSLIIQQGSEQREFRFVETSYDRRPTTDVAPSVFEPDAELLSSRKPETPNSKPETNEPANKVVAASAGLEVELLERLNQSNAFLGEQITVSRSADGQLRVEGVVDTSARKAEIVRALGPLMKNPSVRVGIDTVAEAQARQSPRDQQSSTITLQGVEVTEQRIAVDAELRRYLQGRGLAGDQLEVEMRRFTDRVLQRSLQARLHARALKQIAERFSAAQIGTLGNDERARWRAMINQHARACQQDIEGLRRELQPLFPSLGGAAVTESPVASDDALLKAITRLYALSVTNDESLRKSFSLYAGGSGDAPVRSAQFWRSLAGAESIAENIVSH